MRLSSARMVRRGASRRVALGERGDDLALPAHIAIGREHQLFVGRAGQPFGTFCDLGSDRLIGGSAQGFCVHVAVRAGEREAKSFDRPNEVAFEAYFATLIDFRARH